MNLELVSVIVPVYNAGDYLESCILSILNQSYDNIELILVNDGSTDNSLDICKRFSSDKRVTIIDTPNAGVSSARNRGLGRAKGVYVVFVDSDDLLPADAIQILVSESSADCTAIFGSFIYRYSDGRQIYHKNRVEVGVYDSKQLLPNFIDNGTLSGFLISSTCGALYRKDVIDTHNIRFLEGLKINEDGLFNLELLLTSENIKVIGKGIYIVRKHTDSSSQTRPADYDYNKIIIDYLRTKNIYGRIPNVEMQFKRRIVSMGLWSLLIDARKLPYSESIKYIKSIINSEKINSAYDSICPMKVKFHKRIMYYFMKYNMSHSLYFTVKYVIPAFSSRVSR